MSEKTEELFNHLVRDGTVGILDGKIITQQEMRKPFTCIRQIELMLEEVMKDTMQVFRFGAKKHPDSTDEPNFLKKNGNKCSKRDRGSSILRHAAQSFGDPGAIDSESNLPHLLHLISSACIMYIRHKRNIIHPDDEV